MGYQNIVYMLGHGQKFLPRFLNEQYLGSFIPCSVASATMYGTFDEAMDAYHRANNFNVPDVVVLKFEMSKVYPEEVE